MQHQGHGHHSCNHNSTIFFVLDFIDSVSNRRRENVYIHCFEKKACGRNVNSLSLLNGLVQYWYVVIHFRTITLVDNLKYLLFKARYSCWGKFPRFNHNCANISPEIQLYLPYIDTGTVFV